MISENTIGVAKMNTRSGIIQKLMVNTWSFKRAWGMRDAN